MMLLTIAGVAVIMDLSRMKVANSWILTSLMAGFLICIWQKGGRGILLFAAGAVIPIMVLGGLFCFRMIGAGDIKLFCALGSIMGPVHILKCIWFSFLFGAVFSLVFLMAYGGFRERFLYFLNYLEAYIRTGKRKPYYQKGSALENIHFTVPVFMSVMFYVGGIY